MKALYIALLFIGTLSLSACIDLGARFMYEQDYLEDDSGNAVVECPTQIDEKTGEPIYFFLAKGSAKRYWEQHNLPKGTLYFTCDGDTPLLPKDCQGNELTTPQLRRYWRKYDLPKGTMEFACNNGIPSAPAKRTS